jgi:DNA topoisomerase IB
VLAALALSELGDGRTKKEAKKNVLRAVERVAGRLGNTVAISRKSYVHPVVFDAYLDGTLLDTLRSGWTTRSGREKTTCSARRWPSSPSFTNGSTARKRRTRRRPEPSRG